VSDTATIAAAEKVLQSSCSGMATNAFNVSGTGCVIHGTGVDPKKAKYQEDLKKSCESVARKAREMGWKMVGIGCKMEGPLVVPRIQEIAKPVKSGTANTKKKESAKKKVSGGTKKS